MSKVDEIRRRVTSCWREDAINAALTAAAADARALLQLLDETTAYVGRLKSQIERDEQTAQSIMLERDKDRTFTLRSLAERDEARADLARLGGPDPDRGLWRELLRISGAQDGTPKATIVAVLRAERMADSEEDDR